MNWDKAWRIAVEISAGTGVGHAVLTYKEPSAWLVLVGGMAMLFVIVMGVRQDYKRDGDKGE